MIENLINYLKNKNLAILGFGKEGKSTYKFLRKYVDVNITIFDVNEAIKDDPLVSNDSNLKIVNDYTYEEILENYDLVIKTPGISLKDVDTTKYKDKITSQIELLFEFFDILTIGITGTKGKSTTTSLIYEVLKNQLNDVYIGGNIGIPVFDNLEKLNKNSIYVIELSAYQLQYVKKSPKISLLLNLFEEHLDFFGGKDNYYNAKINIANYQKENDVLFYKGDNLDVIKYLNGHIFGKTYKVMDKDILDNNSIFIKDGFVCLRENNEITKLYDCNSDRILKGNNNLKDIMFVMGVAKYLNLDLVKAINDINSFKGLEHRMEYVGKIDEVTYYNDSIATIPQATINNVETIGNVDTLIFGGMDRGIDYKPLINYLTDCSISNLICMPETGTKIGKFLLDNGCSSNIYFADTLESAVSIAKEVTKKGKSCIMSPSAPSYNYFKNFEEKGNYFKQLVLESNIKQK
ncbi:MAG: UDP-N-acetylmuramoyl-L-alanine--D-glutamate ligase [Bacilli bacterium]|nr:UDP-N-acetylmuramoyl-L-alanine--D-glutamate ligase [Bacilli bacterium]